MKRIAVLLTCHNRRDKTLNCLAHLYDALGFCPVVDKVDIYLTDDGSSDGISQIVSSLYPEVKLLAGDGNLYWAGGMRFTWKEAIKHQYDTFLLLNDDTYVVKELFLKIRDTHNYSLREFHKGGIYIGSTFDPLSGKFTYGGSVLVNRFMFTYKPLLPSMPIAECEFGNANIMVVMNNVVDEIGILSDCYKHSYADYDYTFRAKRKHIPVLVMDSYCGTCKRNESKYSGFEKLSLRQRIRYVYSPVGLAFRDQLVFMTRFFPYRLPFMFIAVWLKILFPALYIRFDRFRVRDLPSNDCR